MIRMTRALPIVLCLCAIVAGCSRDPNVRKQKYLESGNKYFENGKHREAVIQYSNAIQVDPNFTEGHFRLAQAHLKLNAWNGAYTELNKTVDLQPDHLK